MLINNRNIHHTRRHTHPLILGGMKPVCQFFWGRYSMWHKAFSVFVLMTCLTVKTSCSCCITGKSRHADRSVLRLLRPSRILMTGRNALGEMLVNDSASTRCGANVRLKQTLNSVAYRRKVRDASPGRETLSRETGAENRQMFECPHAMIFNMSVCMSSPLCVL